MTWKHQGNYSWEYLITDSVKYLILKILVTLSQFLFNYKKGQDKLTIEPATNVHKIHRFLAMVQFKCEKLEKTK